MFPKPFALLLALTFLPLSLRAEDTPESLYQSALACQTGKGAQLDLPKGLKLIPDAPNAGNAKAMSRLGEMYNDADAGATRDLKLARKWFDKAADANEPFAIL